MGRKWLETMAASAMNEVKDSYANNGGGGSGSKLVGSLVTGAMSGALGGKGSSASSALQAALGGVELGPTVGAIQERGSKCSQLATETVELCQTTQSKSEQMIAFGKDIQSSLEGFSGKVDSSALETIKDLTDGAKLQQAKSLAQGLDTIALDCINKSVQMIDLMEDSMGALPDSVEGMIEDYAKQLEDDGGAEAESLNRLKGVDQDLDDVQSCIKAMQELNLATAFQIGLKAFEQLSAKAETSRALFSSIQGFSTSVRDITTDFSKLSMASLYSKIKDILKCIRLSEVMRALAEATKKIIRVLIDLFQATASKISSLWAALAFAKDCMSDCLEYVLQAKGLVMDAHDKSLSLVTKSESVLGQLKTVKSINKDSFGAIKELRQGDDLKDAISLATNMDEMIKECTSKVTSMVDRVQDGFKNLPDIITDGLDVEAEGRDDHDAQPRGVDEDIRDLEASTQAMEKSDIFTACKTGASGLSSVSTTTESCTEMLLKVRDFSENCNSTIASFMGVWDLESAMIKIQEMCRMVALGNLMQEFARRIKGLVLAILGLLQATYKKLCTLELKDLGKNLTAGVATAVGGVLGSDVGKLAGKNLDQAMNKFTKGFGGLFGKK
ncbi:unnamed protein product [Cylindrotheca closterium]|uniref:Uncharacterized protein n=1 Tax=Cylindrotheca closterium TaxID=2856 RepID=A0AAD2FYB0_9STRA|nr:unnamed protein product [Cylindrotheca closterium]